MVEDRRANEESYVLRLFYIPLVGSWRRQKLANGYREAFSLVKALANERGEKF